jgi:trehalose synthase
VSFRTAPRPRQPADVPAPRAPLRHVPVPGGTRLDDYAALAHLARAVGELRLETRDIVSRLAARTVWMVSSTSQGGGVAEMLPPTVTLLRDLGLRAEWLVIGSGEPAFFDLTKRIHNLIHGAGDPTLSDADRALYEGVNRENAVAFGELLRPGDILVVHDPQPLPIVSLLRDAPVVAIWRCHIGLDVENAATRAAWNFLSPYLGAYDGAVFSAPEYIPAQLARRATVISPGIDPLAPKNRDLSLRGAVEILCSGGLIPCPGPTVVAGVAAQVQRAAPDGGWGPVSASDIGLLTRPIVTQISRWDRLKGFLPLLEAFALLKQRLHDGDVRGTPLLRRRLELARLVLAGPDPLAIQDDPEALEVLEELRRAWQSLPPPVRDDVALLLLPMQSVVENALMVNALQRSSTIVVQNSLREGFGLTIAEAMWKQVPVLSNARACGPRQQIRDRVDGRLIANPEDRVELGTALQEMLEDPARLEQWGHAGQRHVHESFLMLGQLRAWARLLQKVLDRKGG